MNNIVQNNIAAISCVEFMNELDDIFYDLLYSSQNGFINLHSKNAVVDFDSFIDKFDNEVSKLIQKTNGSDFSSVINSKRDEFIQELKKHYLSELKAWAQEVFEILIQNSLFCVSLYSTDKEKIDKIYNKAISAIGWICDIRNFDEKQQNLLVKDFNSNFQEALKADFLNYIPKQRTNKTKPDLFLNILNKYRQNFDEFMSLDFENMVNLISMDDIAYFNGLKNKSKTSQKTLVDDEIDLINCALEILNLKTDNQKYDFIKQVIMDFDNFNFQNKKITEEDKITLVKRRIELFKDSLNAKQEYKYYKKRLISS